MGGRDHSLTCERCGEQYSGFNGPSVCPCRTDGLQPLDTPETRAWPYPQVARLIEKYEAELRAERELSKFLACRVSDMATAYDSEHRGQIAKAAFERFRASRFPESDRAPRSGDDSGTDAGADQGRAA